VAALDENGREVSTIHIRKQGGPEMNDSHMTDESLLASYENVRQQVKLDHRTGGEFRFSGVGAKQYAEQLRIELDRRQLKYTPIDWDG
jgi:hypothetical protein